MPDKGPTALKERSTADLPVCADCRHFRQIGTLIPECHRLMKERDLVTGEARGALRFCHSERSGSLMWILLGFDRCGRDGTHFVARTPMG